LLGVEVPPKKASSRANHSTRLGSRFLRGLSCPLLSVACLLILAAHTGLEPAS
jgi:hypothetical protein